MYNPNMMFFPNHMYYSPFHGLFTFLFWLVVIILVIKLFKRRKHLNLEGGWRGFMGSNSAMETLRERYAKGEIGKEEYEERKRVLQEN
jgi:putative membrane protein